MGDTGILQIHSVSHPLICLGWAINSIFTGKVLELKKSKKPARPPVIDNNADDDDEDTYKVVNSLGIFLQEWSKPLTRYLGRELGFVSCWSRASPGDYTNRNKRVKNRKPFSPFFQRKMRSMASSGWPARNGMTIWPTLTRLSTRAWQKLWRRDSTRCWRKRGGFWKTPTSRLTSSDSGTNKTALWISTAFDSA